MVGLSHCSRDVTYRIITDNQGSVRLVVNAETGEVAQRLDYDSFGRVLRDTNSGFQPFGFQGGLYDPDTGLYYFRNRWYDAETGRWISKDPIGLDGGLNLYEFCGGDSLNSMDPSGSARIRTRPLDSSGAPAKIASAWVSNRTSMGDVDAWMKANDNMRGRNACAILRIGQTAVEYQYFKGAKHTIGGYRLFNTYKRTSEILEVK